MKNVLKDLRIERGWTQSEIAQKLGISRQSVHAIESGKSDPSLALAFRIASLFELSVEQIFEKPD
jgi:putative transcriptional regulator